MLAAAAHLRHYVDPEARLKLLLPLDWRVSEFRNADSRSLLFFRSTSPETCLAISFTSVPPGVDGGDLLAYRQTAEGSTNDTPEPIRRRLGTFQFDALRWRSVSGAEPLEVEEWCTVRGACAILVRVQVPENAAAAAVEIREVMASVELADTQPPPPAIVDPEPATGAWRVQRRALTVRLANPRKLDIVCRLELERSGTGAEDVTIRLPPYPLARLVQLRAGGTVVRGALHHTHTRQELVLPMLYRESGHASVRVHYTIHGVAVDAATQQANGLYFREEQTLCVGAQWLPRVAGGEDSRMSSRVRVLVPPDAAVHAGGRLEHQRTRGGAARVCFNVPLPEVAFAIVRHPAHVFRSRAAPAGQGRTVLVDGTLAHSTAAEIAGTLLRAAALLSRWICRTEVSRRLHVLCYPGERCHGFGPLLLIGRTFQLPGFPMDRRWLGQTTLREVLLHELSHLWFGYLFTADGVGRTEAHEALAGFWTWRLIGVLRGAAAATELFNALVTQDRAAALLPEVPIVYASRLAAVRGTLTLIEARVRAGESSFDRGIKDYFTKRIGVGTFSLRELLDDVGRASGINE